jgi:general secretion pathway protein M
MEIPGKIAQLFQGRTRIPALVAVGVLLGILPLALQALAWSRLRDNNELRETLVKVQSSRSELRLQSQRKESVAQRYANKAPPLAGFLEQQARAHKLEISDSSDRSEVPHGKRYVERLTSVHLKKAGMLPIARFLEALEQSGHPLAISRLSIRKRSGEPNSFDVELGVSAYDRSEVKETASSKAAPVPSDKASK